jgi:hypothetical protein
MTPLPAVIHKGGFELTLLLRNGRVAIYRQHRLSSTPDHDAYEVILPQVRTTNHRGESVEPYEAFPSAESWGKKGWTFTTLAKAVQRLLQLTRKASCEGTLSRRNRLNGRRRSRAAGSQLRLRPSFSGATISRSSTRQRRQRSLQRRQGPYSAKDSFLTSVQPLTTL